MHEDRSITFDYTPSEIVPRGCVDLASLELDWADIEFAALPDEIRNEARRWFNALRAASKAPVLAIALDEIARRFGVSARTARRKYDALRKRPHWRSVINLVRASLHQPDRKLPSDFIEHWKKLCLENQRCSAPAHRVLLREWQEGAIPPGYGEYPEADPVTGIPRGWSLSNLDNFLPPKFEQIAARQGLTAAAPHRRKVLSSRVGVQVGQYYLFDDIWHDHQVSYAGKKSRPLEFHALDLASGCKIGWGIKPTRLREDGTEEWLDERHFRMVLAMTLATHGYNAETGTTLTMENGTAALRGGLPGLLSDLTKGKLVCEAGAIKADLAHAAQYEGRGKGNFRFKAHLESLGNLIHNEMGNLPAQVGMDRDHSPEQLHGILKEHDALALAIAELPPERAALIELPLITFRQFLTLASEIYDRINARTRHRLEGWERCGHLANEYRLTPAMPWMPATQFLALPERERAVMAALVEAQPGILARTRLLAPKEVFLAGKRSQLTALPGHIIAQILGQDFGEPRRVDGGFIEFMDGEVSPDPMTYEARMRTPDGREVYLTDDEKYFTLYNPFAPEVLYVCKDEKGGFLGTVPRTSLPSRHEVERVQREMGAAKKAQAEALAPLRRRHAGEARRRAANMRTNADVIRGRAVTPEEKTAAADEKRRVRAVSADDMKRLTAPSVSAPGAAVDNLNAEDALDGILPKG